MREAGSGSQSRGKYSRKYNPGEKPYGKAGIKRRSAAGKDGLGKPAGGGSEKAGDAPRNGRGKPERKNSTEKRFPGFGSPNRRFRREPLPVSPQPTTQSIARPATFCQQFGPRPAIQSTTRPATQAATAKSPACSSPQTGQKRKPSPQHGPRRPKARPAAHRKPEKRKPGPQHRPRRPKARPAAQPAVQGLRPVRSAARITPPRPVRRRSGRSAACRAESRY